MTRGVQFKRRMQRLLIHLILIIFSIIMIVPFVWMTLTAFKTVTEATSVSPFHHSGVQTRSLLFGIT